MASIFSIITDREGESQLKDESKLRLLMTLKSYDIYVAYGQHGQRHKKPHIQT